MSIAKATNAVIDKAAPTLARAVTSRNVGRPTSDGVDGLAALMGCRRLIFLPG